MTSSQPARFTTSLRDLLVGTVGGQVIGAATIPVLTLLFSPASYGRFASVSAIALSVGSLASLKYERAVVIARTHHDAVVVSGLSYRITAIVTVATGALAVLIGTLSSASASRWIIDALFVSTLVALVAIYQIRAEWMIRKGAYRRIAAAELVYVVVTSAAQIGFALVGWRTADALLTGAILGWAIQLGVVARISIGGPHVTRAELFAAAKDHRGFPLFSVPYSLATVAPSRFVIIISAWFLPLRTVGLIAVAYRLAYIPITTVANALRRVYVRRFVRDAGTDRLEDETLLLSRFVTLLLFPLFLGLGLVVPWVADNFLGQDWVGTGRFIQLFLPGAATFLLTAWLDRIYEATSRQATALLLEASSTVVILGIFTAVLALGTSADVAVGTFGLCIAAYNLFWLGFTWHLAGFRVIRFVPSIAALLAQLLVVVSLYLFMYMWIGTWQAVAVASVCTMLVVLREGARLLQAVRLNRVIL